MYTSQWLANNQNCVPQTLEDVYIQHTVSHQTSPALIVIQPCLVVNTSLLVEMNGQSANADKLWQVQQCLNGSALCLPLRQESHSCESVRMSFFGAPPKIINKVPGDNTEADRLGMNMVTNSVNYLGVVKLCRTFVRT